MKKIIGIMGIMMLLVVASVSAAPQCDVGLTNLDNCWTEDLEISLGTHTNVNITINNSGWVTFTGGSVSGIINAYEFSGFQIYEGVGNIDVDVNMVDGEIYIYDDSYSATMNVINPNGYDFYGGIGTQESPIIQTYTYIEWDGVAGVEGEISPSTITTSLVAPWTVAVDIVSEPDLAGEVIYYIVYGDTQTWDSGTTWYVYKGNTLQTAGVDYTIKRQDGTQVEFVIDDLTELWTASPDVALVFNTEPTITSISPDTRVELRHGETQTFTAIIVDSEDDANTTWTLGGVEVSTELTYTANWDDIVPGIYTLEFEVADTEYTNTESTTLEIRARGGSASGGSSGGSTTTDDTEDDNEGKIQPKQQSKVRQFFANIGAWFRNLFNRG